MSGRLGNVGELGDIGTLVALSAHPGATPERIDYDVHELAGPYYLAVVGHITQTVGTLYTLTVTVDPPVFPYSPITYTVPTSFTTPAKDPSVRTLILYNTARFNKYYAGNDTITSTNLIARINALANNANVNGKAYDLSIYPDINFGIQPVGLAAGQSAGGELCGGQHQAVAV